MPLVFPRAGMRRSCGAAFQAADPHSCGSSRLESRLRARLTAPQFGQSIAEAENISGIRLPATSTRHKGRTTRLTNRGWRRETAFAALALVAFTLDPAPARAAFVLSADGATVYDTVNNVTWLADANLPATAPFGLPLCNGSGTGIHNCVNATGSMNYQAALAWVAAMNAANYLGH